MSNIITAVSTPTGGALAVVRISGQGSKNLLEKLSNKNLDIPRKMYYVSIDTGKVKDKCMVVYFLKESSYTGEESGEVYCHGSKIIAEEIVKFFIENGAKSADRGEFTMRAYLNNRIDLTEAEGILDLINAETIEQAREAYRSADGELNGRIRNIQEKVAEIIAATEVAIDYPEEDIEEETVNSVKEKTAAILMSIRELKDTYSDGKKLREGVKVVICGKPNVGKSSLFNSLVGFDRTIVSNEEGTTRDSIDCPFVYKGRKFVLTDTAGIRISNNKIENEGIKRAEEEINSAHLIIGVGTADEEFIGNYQNVIAVTNKCDQKRGKNLNLSAKTGEGIEQLKQEIYKRTDFCGGIKVNLRQYNALAQAERSAQCALSCVQSVDCLASDLNDCYNALGTVTGMIGSDEIIEKIFSNFCVGK